MTSVVRHRPERLMLMTLLALAVIAVRIVLGNPFIPQASGSAAPLTEARTSIVQEHASCATTAYVTGDLVGDGNPAEVFARLCPQ